MAKVTIGFGIGFIVLGIAAYVLTGMSSMTALIPSFFGVLFVILGGLGLVPNKIVYMIAMHVAPLLALVAIAGTAKGVPQAIGLIETDRPAAAVTQAIMCVASIVLFGLYINSFVQARKKRKAEAAASEPATSEAAGE